jgi:LuxR family maltose regulon positive regulatory protein
LLATKFNRPAPPPKQVCRPHLVQQLNEGLAAGRRLTLVSALPPGFGKTTCVAEWVNSLDGWPVALVSLDPTDNEPARFLAYLVAALQQVEVSLGRELRGVLHLPGGQPPPVDTLSTTLINEIAAFGGRYLLVLDDLQMIQDAFLLGVMERLVANVPPPLHLVLISREDPPLPLSRLRANGRLTEIRAADLRFGGTEADAFLRGVMDLAVSPEDVAVLA